MGNITSIATATGETQWVTTSPGGVPFLVVTRGRLFLNTAENSIIALNATDGSVQWTYAVKTHGQYAWDANEETVIIAGNLPARTVEVVDAATGSERCLFNNTGVVSGPPLAGSTLLTTSSTFEVWAASTATCALQENLSAKFGANPDTAVAFNHELLFVFKATSNATGGYFEAQLINVVVGGNGGWTSEWITSPSPRVPSANPLQQERCHR